MNPYQILHDKLAALEDKRLARLALWDGEEGCGCAIGMTLPLGLRWYRSAVAEYDGGVRWTDCNLRKHFEGVGFTPEFVYNIQRTNDAFRFAHETPAERYERVMAFLKEKINESVSDPA